MMPKDNLSNYNKLMEEDIVLKIKSSKVLLVDLDGTLIDFETIDHNIIDEIFNSNKNINFLDRVLWKINRQDVFGNGYSALKFRIWFYSLLCKQDYVTAKRKYAREYEASSKIELLEVFRKYLEEILNNGYDIVIVTKNKYASTILFDEVYTINNILNKNKIYLIVQMKNKNQMIKKIADVNDGKVTVIGNNFSDDILTAMKLKVPYIYIGRSKPVKALLSIVDGKKQEFGNLIICKKGIVIKNLSDAKAIFSPKEVG